MIRVRSWLWLGVLALSFQTSVHAGFRCRDIFSPFGNAFKVVAQDTVYGAFKLMADARYAVDVQGLEILKRPTKGKLGRLIIPNHPAGVDPVLHMLNVFPHLRPKILAKERTAKNLGPLAPLFNVIPIPNVEEKGASGEAEAKAAIQLIIEALKRGENVMFWPSGSTYSTFQEDIGAKEALFNILEALPDLDVTIIRTHGLWGSSTSSGGNGGQEPNYFKYVANGLMSIAMNGYFFTPKRQVTMEIFDANEAKMPRGQGKMVLNTWLTKFYNEGARRNTYVPYLWWQGSEPKILAEPETTQFRTDASEVDPGILSKMQALLKKMTKSDANAADFAHHLRLGSDLGLSSIDLIDLQGALIKDFGQNITSMEGFVTVADAIWAAAGYPPHVTEVVRVPEPKTNWFKTKNEGQLLTIPHGKTEAEAFLARASERPDLAALADENGQSTYRQVVGRVMMMTDLIESGIAPDDAQGVQDFSEEENIGLMLPAAAAVTTTRTAIQFSGRVPVMLNWTNGPETLLQQIEAAGLKRIFTSEKLIKTIEAELARKGKNLDAVKHLFVYMDRWASRSDMKVKFAKYQLKARLNWDSLRSRLSQVKETAVILFTSGSEAEPKMVPLTHENILSDIRGVLEVVKLKEGERFMAVLPPFHSFGLTSQSLAFLGGIPSVFYSKPTDGVTVANYIEKFKPTLFAATPSFLRTTLNSSIAPSRQFRSLKRIITGGEATPSELYEYVGRRIPWAMLLEGYGTTETSPILAVNSSSNPGYMGEFLPNVEWLLVDPDNLTKEVEPGQAGVLLVRGPMVFHGYGGNYRGESPFIEVNGLRYYNTGDVVTVTGRLVKYVSRGSRFFKVGSERNALGGVEKQTTEVLRQLGLAELIDNSDFALGVEKNEKIGRDDRLFLYVSTDLPVSLDQINAELVKFNPLYRLTGFEVIHEWPLLGTGKTNYKVLKKRAQAVVID